MEDDDSRTASLGRKRDRDSGLKLHNHAKRRRANLEGGTEKQIPTGGSSRTDTMPSSGTESESDAKSDANVAFDVYDTWEARKLKERANLPPIDRSADAEIGNKEPHVEREPGASPSVNWNAGSKAKIRISLGRRTQANIGKSQSNIKTKIADVATRDEDPDTVFNDKFNDPFSQSSQAMYSIRPVRSEDANHIPESSFVKLEHVTASSAMTRGTDDVEAGIRAEPSTNMASPKQDIKDDEKIVKNIQQRGQDSVESSDFESSDYDMEGKSHNTALAQETSGFAGTDSSESEIGVAIKFKRSIEKSNLKQPSSQDSYSLEGRPKILADLNPEELKLQVRYFFLGKSVEDVDRSRSVKCLICTREGHISEFCDSLICTVCGNRSEHNTKNCPKIVRCSRCREPGHSSSSCQRKVLPREVTCGWCELKGHVEGECELFWRTSGRPWESEFTIKSFGLSCYECGGLGHLGNDCPTRRPGKKMGTSTWTLPERSSVDPKGGILIKGRAEQRNPIPQIEKDDDRANFLHPKVVGPPRRAQIQIAPQGFRNAPMRQDNDTRGPRVEQYWPDPRNYRRDQSQPSYQSYGRQTGSSTYYSRDSGSASDRYGSRGGGEPFRPMASSAQKAWVKYRT